MDIYRRYGPALIRKCTRMLGSVQDAEDIVQGLFVDLFKKGNTDVELPYLYRACTNRCLNYIRDNKRRREILDAQWKVSGQESGGLGDETHVMRDLLNKLIIKLDKKSRQILVYSYFDNMTQSEIAELTGYSRKTVGKKLNNIKLKVVGMTSSENEKIREVAL
jgi:RNA polymerase sigma-70 factor (ECF subfamily)